MITLGTDPELFLVDRKTNALIPACGKIGGTKGKALSIGEGYGLQEDNVMVEFNTPPTSDPTSFMESVDKGLELTMDFVRTRLPDAEPDRAGSERVFGHGLLTEPGAMQFGCAPDFNAYAQGEPWAPIGPEELIAEGGQWRFAGGHVHIGYSVDVDVPKFVVAAFADLFLGLRSVGHDVQRMRRGLYGQPGRFRPTPYGIEYRTLSNHWVMNNLSYEIGCRAYSLAQYIEEEEVDTIRAMFKQIPWNDVRRAISTDDQDLAQSLRSYVRNDLGVGV